MESHMVCDREIDKGHPAARPVRFGIKMLVLDAPGLYRQREQVSLLPVIPFPICNRITLPVQDIDRHPPLMAMLAGFRPDLLGEDPPLLQGRIRIHVGVEKIAQSPLTGSLPRPFLIAHPDPSLPAPVDQPLLGRNSRLVGVLRSGLISFVSHSLAPEYLM